MSSNNTIKFLVILSLTYSTLWSILTAKLYHRMKINSAGMWTASENYHTKFLFFKLSNYFHRSFFLHTCDCNNINLIRNGRNIQILMRCMEYFCYRRCLLLQLLNFYGHHYIEKENKSTLHYQFHENQLNCWLLHLGLRFTNSHVNNNNRMSIILPSRDWLRRSK